MTGFDRFNHLDEKKRCRKTKRGWNGEKERCLELLGGQADVSIALETANLVKRLVNDVQVTIYS